MQIIYETAHKARIELEPQEVAALDEAHQIVAERAGKEAVQYDKEALEWTLLGLLREGKTTDEMLEWASNAPLYKKRQMQRGYT